jgi:uncharacterized protein (TIGR02588 family)
MAAAKDNRSSSRKDAARTPFIEWLIGGIGVALFVACVAFLVYEGLVNGEEPGPITASVIDVIEVGDGHVLTFKINNGGTQTLSNLQVSARLLEGEREIESATTMIDYLPGRSSQEGGFYFEHDPRTLTVEIRPEGYQKP